MPNVSAWFQRITQEKAVVSVCGIVKLCDKQIKPVDPSKLPAVKETAQPVQATPKPAPVKPVPGKLAEVKKDEDDFDPFAEGNDEDAAAAEALKTKGAEAKKAKAPPIAKSIIVWEVKPWGEDTDLDALAQKILGITMDGLSWKTEFKKEPIAYGVFKIVIGAVVEDAKVSTDLVEEKIMEFEDDVQSIDIQSFNKL